ncbi:MAG TPA: hypothetical protein VEK11_23715 [Thermoanaerobaculia bacterium]|nr:hypothetical protein [Thermoanaerobaculia bacterium]
MIDADLPARRPVWSAISELFLDTDTTLLEEQVARTLAASPYSEAELEAILTYEVQPVCWPNVFWWEWSGFADDWLENEIWKRRAHRHRWGVWLCFPLSHWFSKRSPEWRRVIEAVTTLRAQQRRLDP